MDIKPILGTAVGLQSVALLGKNLDFMNTKKVSSKNFLKMGVTNMMGIGLLKAQSDIIKTL